ncbi:MAG: hypothetical protein AB1634_06705, partial [Thermodesulfobacteriota bacterium]
GRKTREGKDGRAGRRTCGLFSRPRLPTFSPAKPAGFQVGGNTLPVEKLATFSGECADLGEYAALVASTAALLSGLAENGHLAADTIQTAERSFRQRGIWHSVAPDIRWDGPIYLDELSLTYLQAAGVLEEVCSCGLEIRVHPSTQERQRELIAAGHKGQETVKLLDKIRVLLRNAIEEGKAVFLPYRLGEEAGQRQEQVAQDSALAWLRADQAACDVVFFDDRFLNKYPFVVSEQGQNLPILCTLDLLAHLEDRKIITRKQRWEKLHRLRTGGFFLVPVEPDELEARLRKARFNDEGVLVETVEMRVIRQSLMRVRSLAALQQPAETCFLDGLRIVCLAVIWRLWRDQSVPVDHAVQLCDWVWRNLAPSPLDWAHTAQGQEGLLPLPEALAVHIKRLLHLSAALEGERHTAAKQWVEAVVLEPLLPANSGLLEPTVRQTENWIERLSDEIARQTTEGNG